MDTDRHESMMTIYEKQYGQQNLSCEKVDPYYTCPNLKEVEGDLSMTHEHYECKVCGRRMKLDYEEMK